VTLQPPLGEPAEEPLRPPVTEPPRHLLVPLAGLLFLAVAIGMSVGRSCIPPGGKPPEGSRASTRQEIRRLLEAGPGAFAFADTTGLDSTWAWVVEFYEQRRDAPVWSGREPHRRATQFVDALQRIGDAGLDPRDYDTEELTRLLAQATSHGPLARINRERTLARLDVRATCAFLRVAPHLRDGHVPAQALDPDWSPPSRNRDWLAILKHPIEHDPAQTLEELEPRHPGYRRLRDALDRYRAIAAAGGWPQLPPGPPLALGATGPQVTLLMNRLAMTGDLLPGMKPDTVFDRRLVHAIGELQTRQGIPRSGIVGEATRAILNVPVETRIHQMELNLERWRWLPADLGERRVEVNIPAYHLDLIDHGRVARAMRVVVGKRNSPTPVFSDVLVYMDVNPTWTLPPSVVQKELVHLLRKNPHYLEDNQMYVVSIADAKRDTVDPAHVPWKQAVSDSFLYLVIQRSGPDNPLGQIKMMCPNEYDVYLHDSPQRNRFGVAVRDYSHGCVRVEEAAELADSLVAPALGDSVTIDSLIARGTGRRVRFPRATPVHFLYWTAWADEAGHMCFRDDIYGLDARLDQALRARTPARLALNPGVAVSAFWLAAEARTREAELRSRARH
jgi:murein L,D-transpeptidase YcbB/YkuD